MNPFRESRNSINSFQQQNAINHALSLEMIAVPLRLRTLKKLNECKGLPVATRVYLEQLRRCEKDLAEARSIRDRYGVMCSEYT